MKIYLLAHTYNPNTWEAEAGRREFKASLGCQMSSEPQTYMG